MCCHIGQGFGAIKSAPDAPIDNLIILACQVSSIAAQDLLWGPAMRSYPDLRIAFSEGGIGWIPFYLDRCDRHYTNQKWLRRDFGGRLPSEVFREHSLACYVTDPTSLKLRARHRHRHHRLGVRLPALRLALAGRPRVRPRRAGPRRRQRRRHRQDHVAERLPLLRLGPVRDGAPRAGDASARCAAQATDVDVSIRSRKEWAALLRRAPRQLSDSALTIATSPK